MPWLLMSVWSCAADSACVQVLGTIYLLLASRCKKSWQLSREQLQLVACELCEVQYHRLLQGAAAASCSAKPHCHDCARRKDWWWWVLAARMH